MKEIRYGIKAPDKLDVVKDLFPDKPGINVQADLDAIGVLAGATEADTSVALIVRRKSDGAPVFLNLTLDDLRIIAIAVRVGQIPTTRLV